MFSRDQIHVAGVMFEGRQRLIERLYWREQDGHKLPVDLLREPTNPYDENAVRVFVDSMMVGYIPAAFAKEMAPMIDAGRRYDVGEVCIEKGDRGFYVRLRDVRILSTEVV